MKISKENKLLMDGEIWGFRLDKFKLIELRDRLIVTCKQCVKDGHDTCRAGEDNHCEVRQYLNKIINLLEGTK